MGFTWFYSILLSCTGFHWVLLGFYWVLLGFTSFLLVLQVINRFLLGLWDFTGFDGALLGLTGFLLGFTGFLLGRTGLTRFYQVLPG